MLDRLIWGLGGAMALLGASVATEISVPPARGLASEAIDISAPPLLAGIGSPSATLPGRWFYGSTAR